MSTVCSRSESQPHADQKTLGTDQTRVSSDDQHHSDTAQARHATPSYPCPVLGFVAYSGTGKTTLLRQLLPLLKQRGLRIGVVKHAHHSFDIDTPGKDSYELRKAGADRMLIGSRKRFALMVEHDDGAEPDLHGLLAEIGTSELDLVLVEGFKHEPYDKIELHRRQLDRPLLFPHDPHVIAIASDAPVNEAGTLPRLDLNSPIEIAEFVMHYSARWRTASDTAREEQQT